MSSTVHLRATYFANNIYFATSIVTYALVLYMMRFRDGSTFAIGILVSTILPNRSYNIIKRKYPCKQKPTICGAIYSEYTNTVNSQTENMLELVFMISSNLTFFFCELRNKSFIHRVSMPVVVVDLFVKCSIYTFSLTCKPMEQHIHDDGQLVRANLRINKATF